MVTQEERITRVEAAQEFNAQQSAEILSRLNQALTIVEAFRQEAREMNEVARKEAREANEVARKEAREMNEATRKDARHLFIAALTVGTALGLGLGGAMVALVVTVVERLPG